MKENWEQWAAQQADLQSLDGFCFSVHIVRPASAQSPYSPGRRQRARARPISASPPRTPQLWSSLTGSQQSASHQQPVSAEASGKTAQATSSAGRSHAADNAAEREVKGGKKHSALSDGQAKTSPDSSAATRTAGGESASRQSQAGGRPGSPSQTQKEQKLLQQLARLRPKREDQQLHSPRFSPQGSFSGVPGRNQLVQQMSAVQEARQCS